MNNFVDGQDFSRQEFGEGLFNDKSDGYVDDLARFAQAGVVLLSYNHRFAGTIDRGGSSPFVPPGHHHRGGDGGRRTRRYSLPTRRGT